MTIHDVVTFAIRIEENGEQFYREAAGAVTNPAVKELFERLAREEVGHKRTFEKLLSTLTSYQQPETYEGEYLAYLTAFIDGKAVFRDHPKIPELAKAGTVVGALDFAIQRELDSILFYREMKELVLGSAHASTVDLIIEEEKMHFAILAKLRREETES
jgi:rubrerythrin